MNKDEELSWEKIKKSILRMMMYKLKENGRFQKLEVENFPYSKKI
jgi:hypothetical protein